MGEGMGERGKWVSLPDFSDNKKGKPGGLPFNQTPLERFERLTA